jgi:hypothetical protein
MRHRLAAPTAVALVASSLALLVPASPASADTNVCVGQGVATTGPLVYPITVSTAPSVTLNAPRTVGFAFGINIGTCAPDLGKNLTATGTVNGWCGLSSGKGTTGQGHRFAWIAAGGVAVVTGEVDGIATFTPDPLIAGNSCLTGATQWLVTFAVVLHHCLVAMTKFLTNVGPLPSTLTTVTPLTSFHTGPWGVHYKFCL